MGFGVPGRAVDLEPVMLLSSASRTANGGSSAARWKSPRLSVSRQSGGHGWRWPVPDRVLPGGVSVSRGTDPVLPGSGMPGKIAGYRLEGHIGEGDMTVVRLAHDERLDREVAVKILAPELVRDAAFRVRLLQQVRAAAEIDHPHILPVYEAGDASGIVYVVMRYVRGGDARSLLGPLGPLPFARAWEVIAQVASALDTAHAYGVIHRSVKPANMLFDASSEVSGRTPDWAGRDRFDHVYLSDFGLHRDWSPDEIITAARSAGTLDYVAPEQIEGRALDGRADLYSLACTGFELLCGTTPFGQDQGLTVMYAQLYAPPPPATARRPDLPAAVDVVLATALAKNPADRSATCGQFADELRTALGLVPGESDNPARLRSQGHARPVAESRLASGDRRPAKQQDWEHEPAQTATPAKSGPGQPPSPEDQPAAGLGQVSRNSIGEPGAPYPRQPRRRPGVITLVLAVAAVAIAAAVAIGVALPDRSTPGTPAVSSPAVSSPAVSSPALSPAATSAPSSSSAPTLASRQASAVNNLLSSSAATLKALQGAVSEVSNCTNLSSAVRQIQNVVNQRSTEYNQASALSTSALANGAAVKSDLIAALRNSLDADKDFLTWAQQQLSPGCTPTAQSSAYNAAYNASQQAGASKKAFIQVWDLVAAQYGIQQKSPSTF
jgi:serine/threonine protein kinase